MSRSPASIPNLFIVGQPKSGTTALHQFLDEHPDIFMSPYKEPSYFCADFHRESDAYHGKQIYFPIRNRDQYLELFSAVKAERIVGESSVNYLYSETAAEDIKRFNPNAKIIIILRDPADFLHSLYQMNVRRTWEPGISLRHALELEEQRRQGRLLPSNVNFPSNLFYSKRAGYHDQVKRFVECFDSKQIKILIYEDFQSDNARWYREVLGFLEVEPTFQPEFRIVNPSGSVRHAHLNALLRQRWIVKLGYSMIPKSKHVWIQQNVIKRLFAKDSPPPLDDKLRLFLRTQLAPEVEKISGLLNEDLFKKWGYQR